MKPFTTSRKSQTLFEGYPAKRPWFPFGTHGNYQEVIPSLQDGYPYRLEGADHLLECVALLRPRP